MSRNIIEAAQRLKDADEAELSAIACHDPDMIREVAAVAFAYAPRPKPARRHHADCELRGMDICPCDQNMPDSYYK